MDNNVSETPVSSSSPHWTNNTKLVVGIGFLAILAWVFIRFQNILGPLLMAVVIPYLLHPVADKIRRKFKMRWRLTVNLLYLVFVLLLLGLLTWGGFALVDQISSLIGFLQRQIADFPAFLETITTKPIALGPINFDLSTLGIDNLADQLFGLVQPLLSNLGTLVGSLAGGAATTIGWIFFILLVSYFILIETGGVSGRLLNIQIPGYSQDMRRMGVELGRIWNSFLRGQLIVVLIAIVIYVVLLGGLGVRYFYGLAIIAGLARFIPYVGAWITWISYGLVAFFQGTNIFGVEPIFFVIIVLGISIIVDTMIDNLISTRVMANTLRVHPAAVMFAVIIGASVLGFIGVLLAAPVLATIKLFFDYAVRKMLDMDPWEGMSTTSQTQTLTRIFPWTKKVFTGVKKLRDRIFRKGKITNEQPK